MGKWEHRPTPSIRWWIGLAFLCLHLIHLDLIFLSAFLNPMIQYSCWSMFLTYSVPSCRLSRCAFSNRGLPQDVSRLTMLSVLPCNQGLNASVDLSLITPSFSMKGDYLAISLLFAIEIGTFGKFSF